MNINFAALTLLIIALSIGTGEGWARKTKNRNTFRKAHITINQYHPAGDELSTFADLAALKKMDRDSYDEFMQKVKADSEEKFSEEDGDMVAYVLNDIADMQPKQILETMGEIREIQGMSDELRNELALRVAAAE